MRIPFPQLAAHLASGLAPVFMICGDEPFQLGEAATLVRRAARERGYTEREVLEVEGHFDWGQLAVAAQSLFLFAGQKPRPEHRLLILAPNLDYQELKAKWVQTVEQTGVLLQVQALTGQRLVDWIGQRLRARGLVPEPEVAAMLAERMEGNLLAAAQEVDKLALLQGQGPLTAEQLGRAIADSARFDLFDIPDAALAGDRARMHRIIQGLAAEGTAEPLVLWVLAREVRLLARAAFAAREGTRALDAFLAAERVWQNRQGPVKAVLRRLPAPTLPLLLGHCALADRQIKGLATGDPWLTLDAIGDALAGGPSPPLAPSLAT